MEAAGTAAKVAEAERLDGEAAEAAQAYIASSSSLDPDVSQ